MRKKNSSLHEYLYCPNKQCSNTSIRYDALSKIILKELNNLIKTYYQEDLLNTYLNSQNQNNNLLKEQTILETKIKDNHHKLITLYEDKLNHLITPLEFKKLINIYRKQNNIYQQELNSLKSKLANNNSSKPTTFIKFTHLTKIITDEFIYKIYIDSIQKDIKIFWNI